MKQQDDHPHEFQDDDIEVMSIDDMTEDIVEDFARQLDEVVRIQDEESEEELDNFGYQQLPQDDDDTDDVYQQLQSDEEEDIKDPLQIPLNDSVRLDSETSNLIKSIMSNIQLSNVPEWAKNIPESAWLPHVKEKQ